jgi:hypothetical protein
MKREMIKKMGLSYSKTNIELYDNKVLKIPMNFKYQR